MGYSYNQNGVEHTNEDKTGTKSEAFNQVMDGIKGVQKKLETQITPIDKRLSDLTVRFEDFQREIDQKSHGYKGASQVGMGGRESAASSIASAIMLNGEILSKSGKLSLDVKAGPSIIDSASGDSIARGGVGAVNPNTFVGFQFALDRSATPLNGNNGMGANAYFYSRFSGNFTGGASEQAKEGDLKASVHPNYSQITQQSITAAGFTKMSRQAQADNNELTRSVEIVLKRSLSQCIDNILVNGASDKNVWGGYKSLATPYASTYTALVDAISDCEQEMNVAGFTPNVVVLNPKDWLGVQVAQNDIKDYKSGSYLGQLERSIRGLPVVLSNSVTAGSAYVLDNTLVPLVMCEDANLQIGFDSDDFTRNLSTLLIECRFVPMLRVSGAIRIVTPKV